MEERLDSLTRQTAAGGEGEAPSGSEEGRSQGTGGQADGTGGGSETGSAQSAGGGSRASGGGDPTAIGRAQEVGNRHLGKVGANPYYDFDGGVHLATKDGEFSFGLAGMTQVDGMLYQRPTPEMLTSSGFYNPRSCIYFEGTATKPITWEFSFQNFFDTVQLLDAYANFNYDPRFQVRIGRYKAPFGYEWYRIHIWDLMAPERSLWAVNYEANRRFGAMAWGVLADERVEYALGSFDTQRNSFAPSFSRQDFLGFVNFKPFYPREEGFLLRNLQFGGSVDLGNEHQSPVPAVLRTNFSPGPSTITTPSGANEAELPFLAFGPNVLERGGRALWEVHLAYYYGAVAGVRDRGRPRGLLQRARRAAGPRPGQRLVRAGRVHPHRRDHPRPHPPAAAPPLRPAPGPLRAGGLGGDGPLQPTRPGVPGLHRRPGRPDPLEQPRQDG
jgi:phosphate-selective porin OprO/OprP